MTYTPEMQKALEADGEKSRHTQGPWKAVKAPHGPIDIIDPLGRDVVTVYGGGVGIEFQGANADLIAAAPDLLEAMQGIEHFSDALNYRDDHLSKALRQWIDAGRKAIAKAEGRSNG